MESQYKTATSYAEVMSLVEQGTEDEVTIWQSVKGKKIIFGVKSMELDERKKCLRFILASAGMGLVSKKNLYVKLTQKDAIFKTKISKIEGTIVTSDIPQIHEVRVLKERKSDRTAFEASKDKYVQVSIISLSEEGEKMSTSLKLDVIDISRTGVALSVLNQNKDHVEKSGQVLLTHLGENVLAEPIKLDRKYSFKCNYSSDGARVTTNRMGFELEKCLEQEQLNTFTGIPMLEA